MKEASLTHGGFYAHAELRNALLVEAAEVVNAQGTARLGKAAQRAGPLRALQAVPDMFLGDAHVGKPGHGCPLAALGSKMTRQALDVRAAATDGVEQMAGLLTSHMPPGHPQKMFKAMSCMLGALALARAADKRQLPAAIRAGA